MGDRKWNGGNFIIICFFFCFSLSCQFPFPTNKQKIIIITITCETSNIVLPYMPYFLNIFFFFYFTRKTKEKIFVKKNCFWSESSKKKDKKSLNHLVVGHVNGLGNGKKNWWITKLMVWSSNFHLRHRGPKKHTNYTNNPSKTSSQTYFFLWISYNLSFNYLILKAFWELFSR